MMKVEFSPANHLLLPENSISGFCEVAFCHEMSAFEKAKNAFVPDPLPSACPSEESESSISKLFCLTFFFLLEFV